MSMKKKGQSILKSVIENDGLHIIINNLLYTY
jgi:hypothetical protein